MAPKDNPNPHSDPQPAPPSSALLAVETGAQVAAVADLAREIWQEHYVGLIGQAQVDYMLDKFQSAAALSSQITQGYRYFLVMEDGRPAGYLALVADAVSARMLLSKLYVRRAARGRGLGRLALAFAEEQCRQRGCRVLWLTVNKRNPTLDWYRRQGFVCTGALVQEIGAGFVMDDFRMEKRVTPSGAYYRPPS